MNKAMPPQPDDFIKRRLLDVADNIEQTQKLLKSYEDDLRYAIDPKLQQRYPYEISRLRKELAEIEEEYDRLFNQVYKQGMRTSPMEFDRIEARVRDVQANLNALPIPYTGHSSRVETLAWSPQGQYMASGSHDGIVQVWKAAEKTTYRTYRKHRGCIRALAWSPDDRYIASASVRVLIWEAFTCENVSAYPHVPPPVSALAWASDSMRIAIARDRKMEVEVWNRRTKQVDFTYTRHSQPVTALAWAKGEERIASAGGDRVHIWEVGSSNETPGIYRGHTGTITALAWSPDGSRLASAGGSFGIGVVHVYDPSDSGDISKVCVYREYEAIVTSLSWSPDGRYIASASYDSTVKVWDSFTGQTAFVYRGHSGKVLTVAWSPDGSYIASGDENGIVQVWKWKSEAE